MRHLRGALFLAIVCTPSLILAQTAFDITGTINLNGNLATFSGTIELDTTTGQLASWNVAMPDLTAYGGPGAFIFNTSDSVACCRPIPLPNVFGFGTLIGQSYSLQLFTGNNDLVGFTGGSFGPGFPYTSEYQTELPNGLISMPVSGTIELVPTPEPSTVILMCTGLAGIVWSRKKVLQKLSIRPLLFRTHA